jgi:glycosyltransferase involved in cell wall biosynthesis
VKSAHCRGKEFVLPEPIRIAVIGIRGFPNVIGGPETHAENLYPYLVAKGCEVTVFTRKSYVDPNLKEHKGVKLVCLSSFKNKYLEAFLHTFVAVFSARKSRPDILHVHAIGPSLFVPIARLLGMKVIMTHHGPDYERQKWGGLAKCVLKMGERLGSQWSNNIICISDPIADSIRLKYERVSVVIPNGVNMPEGIHSSDVLEKYRLEKAKYILAVGRFVPEKGFHDLIGAFNLLTCQQSGPEAADLRHSFENWRLVIVGDATHDDAYSIRLRAEAAKNDKVILPGFLSGQPLQAIYANAGLFALPSYYEGLPIVLLEAMSHGLPCVLSDIPANRIVKVPSDRYFKTGDVGDLCAKMRKFITNPLSAKERQEEIEIVRENYGWQGIADRTLSVYRETCGLDLTEVGQ